MLAKEVLENILRLPLTARSVRTLGSPCKQFSRGRDRGRRQTSLQEEEGEWLTQHVAEAHKG